MGVCEPFDDCVALIYLFFPHSFCFWSSVSADEMAVVGRAELSSAEGLQITYSRTFGKHTYISVALRDGVIDTCQYTRSILAL